MGTIIKITPPGGVQETAGAYESCTVNMSITEKCGSFSITLPFAANDDISRFKVGSDVQITQNGHLFRGWVINPPKKRSGALKTITLEGADYTAKTQKIIVTESYEDVAISTIVNDLFNKYVPWATRTNISTNSRTLTIRFPDTYLFDCMEQICQLSGFDWYIDAYLDVNFFEVANTVNQNILNSQFYKAGTANFSQESGKLVNKLWVKGAKAISLPFEQSITVGTIPIPLFYKPRSGDTGITVVIGGVNKTLGVQNIAKAGVYDFLINYQEKLLIPDLCTSGTGKITYSYEYPVKILLESEESKSNYGEFEDMINVDTDDIDIAREVGTRYLEKYSNPIIVGSLEPIQGIYKCGELIKCEIQSLDIDDFLVIKSVSYESVKGTGIINIKLSLENTPKDLTDILKNIEKRMKKIEMTLFGDDTETTIQRYKTQKDAIIYPRLNDNGFVNVLHEYIFSGTNVISGVFRI